MKAIIACILGCLVLTVSYSSASAADNFYLIGPGDVLELHVSVTRGKPGGKVWKFLGRAEVGGELACEAEFTAMMDLGAEG